MIQLLLNFIFISGLVSAGPLCGLHNGQDKKDQVKKPFPLCRGKRQSPIDIDLDDVTEVSLPPLKMTGFNRISAATLTNTGYTAQLKINSAIQPTLSGGPLHAKYEFAQLHFHWGENDNIGSEHTTDGKKYPIELHLVTFNKNYGNITVAMNYADGICALSCLFEFQSDDNKNYNPLVTALSQIIQPKTSAEIRNHPSLLELLPGDLSPVAD